MALFRRSRENKSAISREDLEDAIVRAHQRIEKDHEARLEKLDKKDDMTDLIRKLLLAMIGLVIFICGAMCALALASFFIESDFLASFRAVSVPMRILVAFCSGAYAWWGIQVYRAAKRERDRMYLVSYFSAITSLAALFVALVALIK